jgi:hypothetical protein
MQGAHIHLLFLMLDKFRSHKNKEKVSVSEWAPTMEIQNQLLSLGISDPVGSSPVLEDLAVRLHAASLAYTFVVFVCCWGNILLLSHGCPSCQGSYGCESDMSVVTLWQAFLGFEGSREERHDCITHYK